MEDTLHGSTAPSLTSPSHSPHPPKWRREREQGSSKSPLQMLMCAAPCPNLLRLSLILPMLHCMTSHALQCKEASTMPIPACLKAVRSRIIPLCNHSLVPLTPGSHLDTTEMVC